MSRNKRRVLIVEDEPWVRRGIAFRLKRIGDIVDLMGEVASCEEALAMLNASGVPDVLLTDIVLPERNGLELIEEVKKRRPDLVAYIISGYSEFTYAQRAIELGVSGYLLKPIAPGVLEETMRALVVEPPASCLDEEALATLCGLSEWPDRERLRALLQSVLAPVARHWRQKAALVRASGQLIDALCALLERLGTPLQSEAVLRSSCLESIESFSNPEEWRSFVCNLLLHESMRCYDLCNQPGGLVIHSVQQYIRLHYREELSLDSLARKFSLSPAYLSRCYKAATGEGLSECITRTRIEAACALLRDSALSTAQIAESLNFADASYFTKVFRRFTGETPAAYRKHMSAHD